MSGRLVRSHRYGRERGHDRDLRDRGLSDRAHDGETCLVMVEKWATFFTRVSLDRVDLALIGQLLRFRSTLST